MSDLGLDDFDAYFEAVHGDACFPWQRRLMGHVVREGWPPLLDLPTGVGKTAAIDVALFHLALEARDPSERRAPMRIVMVVDRRTVVDQAFERAEKIQRALKDARGGVLAAIAARLRKLSGAGASEEPVAVALLRGGMPRDDGWASRPDQPLIATSTVDQVGSRLLFRGYGVSDVMRPIHAGLLGEDALLLLDEVHLSQPFQETLASLGKLRACVHVGSSPLPARWKVVAMSATPGMEEAETAPPAERRAPFGLDESDRQDRELVRRLTAKKPVTIDAVKVSGHESARVMTFARDIAARVTKLARPGRVVGVVVNRVLTARAAFDLLAKELGADQVFLLTGRMRPLDRARVDAKLRPLIASRRERHADTPPLVVVATQCIEAGADFDFDALVTECASLDALRQRFGRLNRMGCVTDAEGVILVRSDALGKDPDPIYGAALAATWRWLDERKVGLDFGVDALPVPAGDALRNVLAPNKQAPVLLPAHLDAWVQTRPKPRTEPEVSFFLHGVEERRLADVQIVWRAELTEALLTLATEDSWDGKAARAAVIERVAICAPVALEALSVPFFAAKTWLRDQASVDLADVEGRVVVSDDTDDKRKAKAAVAGRAFVLYRGDESSVATHEALHPGATIVVPCEYGGIAADNWDPASSAPVEDLGHQARLEQTGRPVLRLLEGALGDGWPEPPAPAASDEEEEREVIRSWLESIAIEDWKKAIKALTREDCRRPSITRLREVEIPSEGDAPPTVLPGYFAVVARARVQLGHEATTEGDSGSYIGVEVPLSDHLKGVAEYAEGFAKQCGLSTELVRAIEIAGHWHDAGKADPRFQRMLHGGSEYRAAVAPALLAKSASIASDQASRRRAQERSGYPKGARHELASLALLEAWSGSAALGAEVDLDLVLHLVASHHGHCRPFAPVVRDAEPVPVRFKGNGADVEVTSAHGYDALASGVPDRFFRLVERYGWHGLAWLEAILRLADHRRSEVEQRPKNEGAR